MASYIYDSYFRGADHKFVCEDYARHDEQGACLSDGCSTGVNTHIGAMLLCETLKIEEAPMLAVQSSLNILKVLGYDERTLMCTIGLVYGKLASLDGDGFIFSNGLFIHQKPKSFKDSDGNELSVPPYPVYRHPEFQNKYYINPIESNIVCERGSDITLVFSDGLEQITEEDKKTPVAPETVLDEILKIKICNEGCLRRRCKRMFKMKKWVCFDDFSVIGSFPMEN